MKKALFLALLGMIGLWINAQAFAGHSSRGCFHCHQPHHAGDPNEPKDYGVPLWSTEQNADGLPTFTLYSSKTFDVLGTNIGQPDGPSRMCLGCHDGSYSHITAGSTAVLKAGGSGSVAPGVVHVRRGLGGEGSPRRTPRPVVQFRLRRDDYPGPAGQPEQGAVHLLPRCSRHQYWYVYAPVGRNGPCRNKQHVQGLP